MATIVYQKTEECNAVEASKLCLKDRLTSSVISVQFAEHRTCIDRIAIRATINAGPC
jgi:hypothetical protein